MMDVSVVEENVPPELTVSYNEDEDEVEDEDSEKFLDSGSSGEEDMSVGEGDRIQKLKGLKFRDTSNEPTSG